MRERKKNTGLGWKMTLFLPGFVIYLLIIILPILMCFYYGFFNWDGLRDSMTFVGLDNFARALKDPYFLNALKTTFFYSIPGTLIVNAMGIVLAVLVNRRSRLSNFYRSAFFFPMLISAVAIGFIWKALLSYSGVMNTLLAGLHIEAVDFLGSIVLAPWSILLVNTWHDVGFVTVLYLAGLQAISSDYYDAAIIDGATKLQQFGYITFPWLAPAFTSCVIFVFTRLHEALRPGIRDDLGRPGRRHRNHSDTDHQGGLQPESLLLRLRPGHLHARHHRGPLRDHHQALAQARRAAHQLRGEPMIVKPKFVLSDFIIHAFLLVMSFVFLVPFYITFVNAFKVQKDIVADPLGLPFARLTPGQPDAQPPLPLLQPGHRLRDLPLPRRRHRIPRGDSGLRLRLRAEQEPKAGGIPLLIPPPPPRPHAPHPGHPPAHREDPRGHQADVHDLGPPRALPGMVHALRRLHLRGLHRDHLAPARRVGQDRRGERGPGLLQHNLPPHGACAHERVPSISPSGPGTTS